LSPRDGSVELPSDAGDLGATLGARVRRLRTDRRLSLRELASTGRVSASLLSQLERNRANPSVATLQRIASSLGVSVFALLPDDRTVPSATVVRPENRRKLVIQDGELRYELLSPDTNHQMEVWMGRLGVRAEMGSEFSSHPSEEFIVVLRGRMSFSLGGQTHELGEGSSIQYDGVVPHRIENAGDQELVFLSALTPPTL
jgi:transcriptional regulator with XRE-family HTH domain